MNNFIETGISLILIFFVFSTITYVIQELIAVNLKYRSKMLWKSLNHLLDGVQLGNREDLVNVNTGDKKTNTNTFYEHAQIASLRRNDKKNPNYIPAANFALAVMDMIASKAPNKQDDLFTDFQNGLKTFTKTDGNLYAVLKNLLDTSPNIKKLQEKIEAWFNSYMNRVTGWYESHTLITVRLIAVALTLIFNINVIKIAKTIYKDDKLRSSMVAMAEKVVDNPSSVTQVNADKFSKEKYMVDSLYKIKEIDEKERDHRMDSLVKDYTKSQASAIKMYVTELDSTGLPLGWVSHPFDGDMWEKEGPTECSWVNVLLAIIGWIIGAGCISMGAPFWFDMLNKLVNVRRSGVKPPK
ncbi:MAG TPA: hypothetical protein VGO58_00035 [Chitinophagaceae bacterium]|jgi:hypothetical protein|nr:hypothetical protein [Chitinophagaceae bacterium]